MFVATCFYLSFITSHLLLSRMELTKCTPSILMYRCDPIICPDLSILLLFASSHKAWIYEKFVFELEAFSFDFKIDCILLWQLISLDKKMVVSSGKLHIYFMISYLYLYNPRVGINKNCKYFIAALIYNNIESGHPQWTPIIRVKYLDKEIIYFKFRWDIGITDFNDMDKFDPVTKYERQRK